VPKKPVKREVPDSLRPYIFHGVKLYWQGNDKNAKGECPFCGREGGKFQVSILKSTCRCLSCGIGNDNNGLNPSSFVRELWEQSCAAKPDMKEIVAHRNIDVKTLTSWGVTINPLNGNWVIPAYNQEGKMIQLYAYKMVKGKLRLLLTPTLGHQLFGMDHWDPKKDMVFVAEGPWDAMALWKQLGETRMREEELLVTHDEEHSLRMSCNVLGVPGTNAFSDSWIPLFRNKSVNVLFDNDHPRRNAKTGKTILPAGFQGDKRVAGIIASVASDVSYLSWGEEGYDSSLKDGLDVKDLLTLDSKGIQHA